MELTGFKCLLQITISSWDSEPFLFWSKTMDFMNAFYLDKYATEMDIFLSSILGPSFAVSQVLPPPLF